MTSRKHVNVKISHNGTSSVHQCRKGLGLQALCALENTPIEYDCRSADCGICVVSIHKGSKNLNPVGVKEKDFLKAMNAEDNERLACQCRVMGDVSIEVEY